MVEYGVGPSVLTVGDRVSVDVWIAKDSSLTASGRVLRLANGSPVRRGAVGCAVESINPDGDGGSMLGGRSWEDWIAQYGQSHQHPVNRACHTLGIPLIVVSLPLFLVVLLVPGFWPVPVSLFIVGWIFQFVGHAFERKPPEFFQDWRFLFVGLRWWVAKVRGRA
jgi:hypothetical protein